MIIKIITMLLLIYLLAVFRVYVLTLYYIELDGIRKYLLISPYMTFKLLIYVIGQKDYEFLFYSLMHLPTTFVSVSFQYCLMRKKHADSKRYISKQKKKKMEMEQLHCETEKLIFQC